MKLNQILLILMFFSYQLTSQVLIEKNFTGAPDTNSILELRSNNKGLLLPRLNNSNITNMINPAPGMLLYNQNKNTLSLYNANKWINFDTSYWQTNNNRIYLKSGLANNDSIFYDQSTKQFVFADELNYTSSQGNTFPVTAVEGKYYFKAQASRFPQNNSRFYSLNTNFFEIDNTTASDSCTYTGQFLGCVINPTNNAYVNAIYGIDNATVAAGTGQLSSLFGIYNRTTLRGGGYVNSTTGITNLITLGGNRSNNVDEMFGIQNILTAVNNTNNYTHNNVYGILNFISPRVVQRTTGNAYGLYISPINSLGIQKSSHYAIYTEAGNNRFGDSLLITTSSVTSVPRAILDVNATTSMIIPSGSTAQRPISPIEGQLRYNNEEKSLEVRTNDKWSGIYTRNVVLDPPSIPPGEGMGVFFGIPGALTTDVVTVNPVGNVMLPGTGIAWANVYANGAVEVHFMNYSTTTKDIGPSNFLIKLIR